MEDAVAPAVERRLQLLRAGGHRVTAARRAVLEVLAGAAGEHLSAEDVVQQAAARRPGVHRATVYRAVEALRDLGLLTHTHSARGATTYHLATGEPHAHVQCSACGILQDVPAAALADLAERLAAERGFVLDPGHVALLGTCRACSRGRDPGAQP
ncbi:Fur family transcriptional regulator [Quadrisphaera sp. DSM 44207]|uniref:Fur family transcriptional regulator n=1 Tax=Quadrisphaera sp. DSM 44207 TaxID=1881057 RepID=UPI0015A1756F|nr:transcriptional repressor [Quadrisphaera sp. DSM 44207]